MKDSVTVKKLLVLYRDVQPSSQRNGGRADPSDSAAGRMSDAQTSPRRSRRRLPTGIPTLGGTRTWAQDVDRASAKQQCTWPESEMRRAFDAPRASSSCSRRRAARKDLGRSRTPIARFRVDEAGGRNVVAIAVRDTNEAERGREGETHT